MEARVNGSVWGGGNSKDMHHSSDIIVTFLDQTIYPGGYRFRDGWYRFRDKSGKKLAPGDEFELEIEKIGTLSIK